MSLTLVLECLTGAVGASIMQPASTVNNERLSWRTLKTNQTGSSASGSVHTITGNWEAGFADRQGEVSRFNHPKGLARDKDRAYWWQTRTTTRCDG